MKTLSFSVAVLSLAFLPFFGLAQNAFFDQPLIDKLEVSGENELLPVMLVLEETVDLGALKLEFETGQVPVEKRAQRVMQELKTQSAQTQPAVLEFIQSGDFNYGDIQTFWIANIISLNAEPALIEALALRDDINYIYLNRNSFGFSPKPEHSGAKPKSVGGIEPGLAAVGAPELWTMGYTGHGRIAMTFDTGIWDDHPSHEDRFLANRMPLTSTWFAYDSPWPIDKSSSHGTHVTGIMLGLDPATADTIGVAPQAYYIATDPVVSNLDFVKPLTDFMFGYEWALNPDGDETTSTDIPDVINNSWGFGPDLDEPPCPEFVIPVFTAVELAGIANVFSAGNEGPGPQTMSVPHNTNIGLVNSFTVGAVFSSFPHPIAAFSSRGPSICGGEGSLLIKPEVAAPGIDVRSSIKNGQYDLFNGTSMAAPHVSGAVLLLKEAFPFLTGEEILLALYNSATDLGDPGEDNITGKGIINVKSAFDYLSETYTPVPPAVAQTDLNISEVVSPVETIRCSPGEGPSITATIRLENKGANPINGVSLEYGIVGDPVSSYEYEGSLAPGAEVLVELPQLNFEGFGRKELHIKADLLENEYDVLNNQTIYRWIELPRYDWNSDGALAEDFELGIDSTTWTVWDPDAFVAWDTVTAVQADGNFGLSARIPHTQYPSPNNEKSHLLSPMILNRPADVQQLAFDYYWQRRIINSVNQDTLIVYLNRSCGDEYMSEEIFREGGVGLSTVDGLIFNALPQDAEAWSQVVLDLDLETDEPFFFSFVGVNRRGNNLLVDNILLGESLSSPEKDAGLEFSLFPNPANSSVRIQWTEGLGSLRVYDISGRILMQKINIGPVLDLDLGELSKGVYLVEVAHEKGSRGMERLIVQ